MKQLSLNLDPTSGDAAARQCASEDAGAPFDIVIYLEDGIRAQLVAEIDPLELAKEIFFHRVAHGVGSKGYLQILGRSANRRIYAARLMTPAQLTLRITMVPLKRDLSRVGYFVAGCNYRTWMEDSIAGQSFEEEVTLRVDMLRGEFR